MLAGLAEKLLECCKKNKGLLYAMFETSRFHDDLYAMEKICAAGGFGKIIYSEGEYCHTRKPGAPSIASYKDWRRNGAPMWYPTHATAYYVGVTHGSFVDVSLFWHHWKRETASAERLTRAVMQAARAALV